jgi:hypothetical protein
MWDFIRNIFSKKPAQEHVVEIEVAPVHVDVHVDTPTIVESPTRAKAKKTRKPRKK